MQTHGWKVAIAVTALLLLLVACSVEEDLHLNSDGSGSYRVKITISKQLGEGFDDFRKEAEKNGFAVDGEGETETDRFIVIHKNFSDVSALNDDTNHFEFTAADTGFLRRECRLRVSLKAIGLGGFKRHIVITMPGSVTWTTVGEAKGDRVTWEGTEGVQCEIVSRGFSVTVSGSQRLLLVSLVILLVLVIARRRQRVAASISQA